MIQSRRIDPLLRRAQEHEDSVARDLAERQRTLAQHESRLEELRQYAEDYANSQMAATSPAQLANRRAFLERIDQALAGFGDPVVVFIAALFVVTHALETTGLSAWVGTHMSSWAADRPTSILVLTMVACAGLSAFVSVNAAVAAMVPVAVVIASRAKQPPSRVMMPMAFASHAGSLLADDVIEP